MYHFYKNLFPLVLFPFMLFSIIYFCLTNSTSVVVSFHQPVASYVQTVTSIWGLVALQLADEEFLPFNYLSYANELQVCF